MKKKLFIISLFTTAQLFAQQHPITDSVLKKENLNSAYLKQYAENSEFSYTSPFGEIGAPTRYVLNGKLTTSYFVFAPERSRFTFVLQPDFTVRVRKEQSAGVRTPSFKFGGTLNFRISPTIERYAYASLGFVHHSNGQDGSARNDDGTINTQTGNFSTNYLIIAYRFGSRLGNNSSYGFHHGFSFQWNKWFSYEPVLEDNYGFSRVNYDLSFRKYPAIRPGEPETWRLQSNISYAINKLNNYSIFSPEKRLNAEISFHYRFPFMRNVYLMTAAGYYGEDPYNIYFQDLYAYVRLGLSSRISIF